jgi:cation:H+ antiporter
MELFLLLVGLGGLWLGTEATIRGAVSIAARFHVPEFIVGVAILSVGSDLPELAIAVDAALKNLQGQQASDIIVGSAIGSGLGQIGFVLGVSGLIAYLTLPRTVLYQHGGVLLGSLILLWLFGYDGVVSRIEGLALIVMYAIYLLLIVTDAMATGDGEDEYKGIGMPAAFANLVIGLLVVTGSAELTVSSATNLAEALNVEPAFIAIVIIGLGSSLPEFSISLGAILKQKARLSVGNLIGSNVFDTLVPVGVASMIARLEFDRGILTFEVPVLFVLSAIVLVFFRQTKGIQKREAIVILSIYVGYVVIKLAQA